MWTRALPCIGVLLGLAVAAVRADEPKPGAPAPSPITWSNADARVAEAEAPLCVQVSSP